MNNWLRLILPFLMGLVSACAADTEADAPGSCSLSCSQPKVGASNYKIELNGITVSQIFCNADFATAGRDILPANGPIAVRFQIYEVVTNNLPGSGATPAASSSGEASGSAGGGPILDKVPKGGIGFEPILYGGLAVEQTNPEHKVNDTTASPFKFAGVVTPKSEWCSDTCGNISYEFWPYCQKESVNNVSASVLVEGARTESSVIYEIGFTNN